MSQSPGFAQLSAGPIFVGGHPRSGTTWVYDLLTAHELVAGVFESWLFSPMHGVGGVFAEEQWDAERISEEGQKVGRQAGLHQMVSREEMTADLRALLEKWMGEVLEPQHRFIVEKSPMHLLGMPVIREVFPDARFIHIVRDGRDVAVSLRAAAQSWAPQFGAMDGRFFYKPARSWRTMVGDISTAGAELGDRYLEVRFEDLVENPADTLTRMFEFCEIPSDGPTVERILEAKQIERVREARDAFRRKGKVGGWRSEFGPLDALAFNRAAGDMLVEKGYERNRRWWIRAPW